MQNEEVSSYLWYRCDLSAYLCLCFKMLAMLLLHFLKLFYPCSKIDSIVWVPIVHGYVTILGNVRSTRHVMEELIGGPRGCFLQLVTIERIRWHSFQASFQYLESSALLQYKTKSQYKQEAMFIVKIFECWYIQKRIWSTNFVEIQYMIKGFIINAVMYAGRGLK